MNEIGVVLKTIIQRLRFCEIDCFATSADLGLIKRATRFFNVHNGTDIHFEYRHDGVGFNGTWRRDLRGVTARDSPGRPLQF
jgi:hypothetical protein